MPLNEKDTLMMTSVASQNYAVAEPALGELATALTLPLRDAVLNGDIISNIYQRVDVNPMVGNTTYEYPLSPITPGTEGDYVAYTVPTHGSIPYRVVQGDYIQIPLYDIANSIDWDLKFQKRAQYEVPAKMGQTMVAGVTQKLNDDGFHTLLAAASSRNVIVADSDASAGQFSTRLVSLLKTVMRRNGGGNSTSMNRSKLTDLLISPEAEADMRSWNVDVVDELTRREIFTAEDGTLNRIFQVNLWDIDEFGEGQKYQTYFTSTLSGTMPTAGNTKLEIALGLDLSKDDAFLMPIEEDLVVQPDNLRLRDRMAGLYCYMTLGFGVTDSRRVLLAAI